MARHQSSDAQPRREAQAIAGVRNFEKAQKLGLGDGGVILIKLDVTSSASEIADALGDADVLICATGFVPGNPFKMNAAAKAVSVPLSS
jgi:hypothetical protein